MSDDETRAYTFDALVGGEKQKVEVIASEKSLAMTNGNFGGYVMDKNGSFISIESARAMNRSQRRKRGIKLIANRGGSNH